MPVEGAEGGSHQNENKQETMESSISAEETVFDITDDGKIVANSIVLAGNNERVDSRENVGEVGDQEKETLNVQNNGAGLASEEGANEMLTEDNDRKGSVMGNLSNQDTGEEKDLDSPTETVASDEKKEIIDDDTNTTKEVLSVPKKKVLRPKKVVKKVIKRKVVKGKVLVKNEEEPQSSDMPEFVEVPTNQGVKDMPEFVEVPTNQGVKDEEKIYVKSLDNLNSSLTEAVSLNEKEEEKNDDTNTAKEASLVPNKKVVMPKKVVMKRKLVKRKVASKDEGEPQSSETPKPSIELQTNENVENEESPNTKLRTNENVENEESPNTKLIDEVDEVKSSADAVTLNEKEEIINDDTNTTKEVLLVPNKVLKPKRVVKKVIKKVVKRKLVKGKVVVEESQSSKMLDPSMENLDIKPMEDGNSSSTVRTKKNKQSENNEQAGKEKAASKSENFDNTKKESKIKLRKVSSTKAEKGKSSNEAETMGMIFMCSSKTKEDCYRYKIFGLPASKKDLVLKVHKGMKLFLFDFQLKLLYGIYQADGPGGYNIEPKAFHSNFPSQVRFTIVQNCNPLSEAKFKQAIKDNYYTKNKFSCELNSKQVSGLCELFGADIKGTQSKPNAVTDRPKAEIRPIVDREKKRKATAENEVNQGREKKKVVVDSERDTKRRRVVDDVKRTKAKGGVRPSRVNGDVGTSRVNDVRHPVARGDVRCPRAEDDSRRLRLEDNARRARAKDDARRARAKDDARRARAKDDARRLWFENEARRLRLENDARRLRLDDDARHLRLEDEARRKRDEDDARRRRDEDDARRQRDEDEARRRDEDRRLSPHILTNRYTRLADLYDREAYLPSALPAPLHIDAVPSYTSSYGYGRTSVLDEYRPEATIGHESQGLSYSGSRLLYEYETRNRNLPYREPIEHRDPEYPLGTSRIYSPIASRDEYLPSTSSIPAYRVSPYRRY